MGDRTRLALIHPGDWRECGRVAWATGDQRVLGQATVVGSRRSTPVTGASASGLFVLMAHGALTLSLPGNLPFAMLFLLSHTLSPQIFHGGGDWTHSLRSGVGAARGGLRRETKLALPGGIRLHSLSLLTFLLFMLYESIYG